MTFGEPGMLWLLLLAPGAGLALWAARAARSRSLRAFAGGPQLAARFEVQVSRHRRAVKMILLLLALTALALASARPQWGAKLVPVTRRGADIVVVLDTSLSMAAEDLAPNRLGQAEHAIQSLLGLLEGDRVALVTFAGRANLICPLTVDHAAVRLFLESTAIDSVPVPGTALAEAMRIALRALRRETDSGEEYGRAVVLLTDGEDHEGGLEPVLEEFAAARIPVYAVGTGTARGAPIPLRSPDGTLQGYKKDRQDRVVTTRLDENLLETVALETGGRYYRATAGELEMQEVARALAALDAGEFGARIRTRYREQFQIPLALGLLALLAETALGDRVRREARPGRSA